MSSLDKVVQETKTHILCSRPFFFLYTAIYELTWKNMLETDRQTDTPGHKQHYNLSQKVCSFYAG